MHPFQDLIDSWVRRGVEPAPVGKLVGFKATGFADGVVTVDMDAGPQHHNPMGSSTAASSATWPTPPWAWPSPPH